MRVTEWAIWSAWVLIAGFFLFALAAASAIPFGNTPVSFAEVTRAIGFSSFFGQLLRPWPALALGISVVPVLVHTFARSYRMRVWVPLLCLIGVLLWFTAPSLLMAAAHVEVVSLLPGMLLKSFAQWLLAVPFTAYFTVSAVLGRQDGEFYADGLIVYSAMGWWMMLCLAFQYEDGSGGMQPNQAMQRTPKAFGVVDLVSR